MNVVVRNANLDDLPRLEEIERQSFSRPHWRAQDFADYDCLVAEVNCRVEGFLVSREAFPGDRDSPPEREILNLAVAPESRRQGIATILMKHEFRHRAVYFLEVRKSNVAAQTLYRALGFVEIGSRTEYYRDPSETAIVMRMK